MSDHCDPFPPLPTETTISIIEAAANQRETALNLCLVSKEVYNLVKPILYHSVQVKWYNFQRFHQWFFNFSPIDPHKHHRSLIRDLTIVCRASYLFRIVDTCDRLERLVCNADVIECTRTKSRPKELVICADNDTSTLYGGYIPPGAFAESVTHLYVNLPVLGLKFVETVEGMRCIKYVGMSLMTMGDSPEVEEGLAHGIPVPGNHHLLCRDLRAVVQQKNPMEFSGYASQSWNCVISSISSPSPRTSTSPVRPSG